jgi:hypothetical protein
MCQCISQRLIDAPGASRIDLRHLRAFVTIVDAGGFGRAVADRPVAGIAWDPRRFLAPYAAQFIEELVAYGRYAPADRFTRRAPPLPRLEEPARASIS